MSYCYIDYVDKSVGSPVWIVLHSSLQCSLYLTVRCDQRFGVEGRQFGIVDSGTFNSVVGVCIYTLYLFIVHCVVHKLYRYFFSLELIYICHFRFFFKLLTILAYYWGQYGDLKLLTVMLFGIWIRVSLNGNHTSYTFCFDT